MVKGVHVDIQPYIHLIDWLKTNDIVVVVIEEKKKGKNVFSFN